MFVRHPRKHVLALAIAGLCGSSAFPNSVRAQEEGGTAGAGAAVRELEAVTITGTPQSRYDSRNADSLLRIPMDTAEVPRAIDVLPSQLIQDQQARELDEVFRLSPNVVSGDGYGGTVEDFTIRGFRRADAQYRNGVRIEGFNGRVNPSAVESIQIIKGPVADIGQMPPGGLINIETKKPLFSPRRAISASFDEHGQRKYDLDLAGPLGAGRNWAYRLVGSVEDSENFRDVPTERRFFSPSIAWRGDNGATVTFNYEYSRDKRQMDRGLITVPTGSGTDRTIVDVSRKLRYDNPDINRYDVEYNLVELDASMPVGADWRWENKLLYFRQLSSDLRSEVRAADAAGALSHVVSGNDDRHTTTKFVRTQMAGDVQWGIPISLVGGFEFYANHTDWTNFNGAIQRVGTVYDPQVHQIVDNTGYTVLNPASGRQFNDGDRDSYSAFGSASLALTDTVFLDLGLRYQRTRTSVANDNLVTGASKHFGTGTQSKFTTGAGVLWKATSSVAFYGNYAKTYNPQYIYTGQDQLASLPPENGRQYEIGTRWTSPDDRYYVNLALFDIRQHDVAEFVNGVPELVDGVKSRGAELSVVANPAQGFNLRAALGYVDAEASSSNPLQDGNRPTNIPATTASLWASYEFQGAAHPLRGLGVGAGVTYVGKRYGDLAHSFSLGDYTVVDLGAWYYLKTGGGSRVRFDVGVKNLTDERYYTASGGAYRVNVGAPRTFFAGVRYEF